jgi:hypothetical protein
MMDQVGSDAGSEKDTEGWVSVTKAELPVSGSEFTGGSSSFTVPSWAPGSSDVLARWSARLTIERGGRDIDTRGDFTVVVGLDNVKVADEPQQRTAGDGETNIDTVLPSLAFGAAETINGSITLTPQTDMSNGELGIYWGAAISPILGPHTGDRRRDEVRSNDQARQGNNVVQRHTGDGAVRGAVAR